MLTRSVYGTSTFSLKAIASDLSLTHMTTLLQIIRTTISRWHIRWALNFQEFIGIVRYQPVPKWSLEGKLFYWKQGTDTSNTVSYGSNIFLPYTYRNRDIGFHTGDDLYPGKTILGSISVSYEMWQNFFIDLSAVYRKYDVAATVTTNKTTLLSIGVRLNASRRKFEF
jgi:hypothetical protein